MTDISISLDRGQLTNKIPCEPYYFYIRRECLTLKFFELKVGEFFLLKDNVYMKINNNPTDNSMMIGLGTTVSIDIHDTVFPLDTNISCSVIMK